MTPAPWEHLPGESAKAYAAFCLYRDLGPHRSLDETSRQYHAQPASDEDRQPRRPKRRASGLVRRWAERWDWSGRALAWDHEVEQGKQKKQLEAIAEMAERHAREAMLLQNKAVERLRQLLPGELSPQDTLRYLIEAAKLERLARGEPTERVAEEHRFPDLKELSDAELLRILASRPGIPPEGGRGAIPPPGGAPESP
jgi:hypothetical protein